MAIDYIIGGLQLLSAAVNVLALGAFWVTPGLRTTANRFVINLLVVNVIGCLALTPALWLHGGLKPEQMIHSESMPIYDNDVNSVTPTPTIAAALSLSLRDEFGNNDVKLKKSMSTRLECIERIGSQRCDTVLIEQEDNVVNNNNMNNNDDAAEISDTKRDTSKNDGDDDVEMVEEVREESASIVHRSNGNSDSSSIVKEEIETSESAQLPTKNILYSDCTRFWGFDLVAALGGLSVVLVVGDTWCAVTDPLRYHSRVSGLKSWILIASTWFISILFCIASAFRSDCRLITIKITSTLQNAYWRKPSAASEQHFIESTEEISHETVEFNEIYNLIYSCTFFVVIILLPICLVCAMYWKIFSEARQNGLRMRQNGSSPLLQSALNLATVPSLPLTGCSVIGEEDDSEDICVVSALPAMRRNSVASPHHVSYNLNYTKPILMKMQTSPAKGNRHVYHQQHRRYLDIPKFVNNASQYGTAATVSGESDPNHNSLSSTESTPSRGKCSFSGNGLMQFDGYAALSTESTGNGDLRQVHSTPDLQKSMNAEILAARQSVAERNSKKIHSTGSIHTTFPVQPPSICTPPKALSYMTSIRHRLSNASSIFKYREESRAARISILVVIMFLFSYFPYGLLVLLQGRVTFIANSSFLGVLFLLIASTSSPFIFAYRNRRVRRGVCRLFGVDAKTNERLQKQRILMRSTTHSSSCRDGAGSRKSPKAKIVRINRNTAKSASFAAPRSHIPCKYAPVVIPMTSDEYETPAIKSEFETDSFISNANHGICMPNDTDNDDDESDGIAKMIVDQYVPIEEVVLNQNMPLDLNEFVRIHNSNSSNNHVIKQKISLLKRVCKTSRKLSKCTSDASIERIYYDSSCTKCPPPVNV